MARLLRPPSWTPSGAGGCPHVWRAVLAMAVSLALLSGCGHAETSGCPDVASPTQGVDLFTEGWSQHHPGERLKVCLVSACGRSDRELGQQIHDAKAHVFVARVYTRDGRLIHTSRLRIHFRYYPRTSCMDEPVWSGGTLSVNVDGKLMHS
jgi:hypothetical protein